VSDEIDAPGLAEARRAFGLTETKALVYDNLGREGDWARSPDGTRRCGSTPTACSANAARRSTV